MTEAARRMLERVPNRPPVSPGSLGGMSVLVRRAAHPPERRESAGPALNRRSMTVQLTPVLRVTTIHPLSRGGSPVLVVGSAKPSTFDSRNAYTPAEIVEIFGRTAPAAHWACFYGSKLTGLERQLVADYLQQWREGPQLTA